MITPKQLKKLADTCRKSGIKHFKNAEFEFTLTDDAPIYRSRSKNKTSEVEPNSVFQTETLSEEELLFYSVSNTEGLINESQ